MAVKTEVIQIEERDFTKIILFVSGDKGDLKYFQKNFETFFTSICHNLTKTVT